jgi:urea ABC transporter permease protein UrtC
MTLKEETSKISVAQNIGSSKFSGWLFAKGERYGSGMKSGLCLVVLAIFPWMISSYQLDLLSKFLTFCILALSLDLIWGYAGILSFAHSIFFGLGSYGLALTLKYWGHIPGATYVGILLAIILPSFLALLIGYAMFFRRVGGVYFAIVTFALGGILHAVTIVWIKFTGGLNGLYGFPNPRLGIPGFWEFEITTGLVRTYYLIAVVLVLIYFFTQRLMKSPFGQILRAINNDEERVESLGYNVPAIKLMIFVISCAIAGVSGALYVPVGFVSADIMGILFSTGIIVWVAVGGRGTLFGAVLGALVVNYLQVYMSDILVFYWYLIIGIFFIFVVLVWPDGIIGIFNRLVRRFDSRLKDSI